jgi:hypothetical protein
VNFKVVSAAQDEDDIEGPFSRHVSKTFTLILIQGVCRLELPRDVYVLFDPRGLGFDLVGTYPVTAKHITPYVSSCQCHKPVVPVVESLLQFNNPIIPCACDNQRLLCRRGWPE